MPVLTRTLPLLLLAAALVTACTGRQPSATIPLVVKGIAPTATPFTSQEKVARMVTLTPTGTVIYRFPTPGEVAPTAVDPGQVIHPATPAPRIMSLGLLKVQALTYTDSVAGLAFDYPANWQLTDPSAANRASALVYSFSLRSPAATPLPRMGGDLPPGMTAIDITVYNQGPRTLEQAIRERRAAMTSSDNGAPVQIQGEEDWVLAGGVPAHRFLLNLGPEVAGQPGPDRIASELVTLLNGHMVLVSGRGDMSLVNAISGSLREVK